MSEETIAGSDDRWEEIKKFHDVSKSIYLDLVDYFTERKICPPEAMGGCIMLLLQTWLHNDLSTDEVKVLIEGMVIEYDFHLRNKKNEGDKKDE